MDEKRETKPASLYDELFPGRFMKATLFKGEPHTLRISEVHVEKLPEQNGASRWRGVVSFAKTEMQLVLNRTNGECIKAMFGPELANWVGKRVTFFPKMVESFGQEELAIRVLGSPDIPKDVRATIELPRKKPFSVLLKKTAIKGVKPAPQSTEPPADEPGMDPLTGEVPMEDEAATS